MPADPKSSDYSIGVLGAGAMGRGIVQVAAAGGMNVKVFDARRESMDDAVTFIGNMFKRAAERGRMTEEEAAAATARTLQGFAGTV